MKKLVYLSIFIVGMMTHFEAIPQGVAINNDNSTPDPSSMLDVKSTTKGVLVPRLSSAQRTAISNPSNGLLVFDADTESFWFYSSEGWTELIDRGNTDWEQNGSDIYFNTGKVGIGTNTPSRLLHAYFNNTNLNTSPFLIEQAGTGDAFFNIGLTGSHHYNLGVDNSDNGKFKIGYSATEPFGISVNTRFTITNTGLVGIGTSIPSDRFQVDALAGEPAMRVRINGDTKFRVHDNGGISVGVNSAPPVDGLLVNGLFQPNGHISTPQSLFIESTGINGLVQLKKSTNNLLIDQTGLYAYAEDNLIMQTFIGNNKITLNNAGISATTDNDILIETAGVGKVVKIQAGSNLITIDETGGITINSGGNDLTINTVGGDFNLDAGNGDVNITSKNIVLEANNNLTATSANTMLIKSTFNSLNLQSSSSMNLTSSNSINLQSSSSMNLTSSTILYLLSGTTLKLFAGSNLDLDGTTIMTLNAPALKLNDNSNGFPAARQTSAVLVNPTTGIGSVTNGSTSVTIGN